MQNSYQAHVISTIQEVPHEELQRQLTLVSPDAVITSVEQMLIVMQRLGSRAITYDTAKILCSILDDDLSGQIDIHKLQRAAKLPFLQRTQLEGLLKCFIAARGVRAYNPGFLTKQEIYKLFLQDWGFDGNKTNLFNAIEGLDVDHNGQFSIDELLYLCTYIFGKYGNYVAMQAENEVYNGSV